MSCKAAVAEPWVWRLWRSSSGPARLARGVLRPLSWSYAAVVGLRANLYRSGWLEAKSAGVPVIGVGNISVGGTGKTPFVIWLAENLRKRGKRVTVVARGFGARRPAVIAPAASGSHQAAAEWFDPQRARTEVPAEMPDEALLVALRASVPVVTGADRLAACRTAVRLFSPDVILLDDGFQHLRLARDLDIVLLGPGERQARVLPAGPLREPPAALARADVIVETAGGGAEPVMTKQAAALVEWPTAKPLPLERLAGARVFAFAGIARPWSFLEVLDACGARREGFRRFADHHRYSAADWERITRAAAGCDWIVTTEKDLVKIRATAGEERRLVALRIDVEVERADEIVARCLSV